MCVGIEYFLDGERKAAYFESEEAELAVLQRGGAMRFYPWGARRSTYYVAGNTPGWGAKFPETGWAPLEDIRAGRWARFEPRSVRIVASRFVQVDSWKVPRYF